MPMPKSEWRLRKLRKRCKTHKNCFGKLFNPWSIDLRRKKQKEIRQFLSFVSIGLFFTFFSPSLSFSHIFLVLSATFCFIINHHVFLPHKSREEKMSVWIVFEWIPTVDECKMEMEIRNTWATNLKKMYICRKIPNVPNKFAINP